MFGEILANQHAGTESHAFGFHLFDTQIDVHLLHLEVRNAITQQPADTVILFENSHIMADTRQLLRSCHTGRTSTHNSNFLAGLDGRRLWLHPAVFPALVDDEMLDRLDTDRLFIDTQSTGSFTRRRADTAREFGEIVGRM